MKIAEIRQLNEKELKEKLNELRVELIKYNAQISTGTNPKSPGQIRQVKKTIARILTVLKEKEVH